MALADSRRSGVHPSVGGFPAKIPIHLASDGATTPSRRFTASTASWPQARSAICSWRSLSLIAEKFCMKKPSRMDSPLGRRTSRKNRCTYVHRI